MERWTCPKCKRIFGKANQRHMCGAEALTLDEYFDTAKPWEQPIFSVIAKHFATHGPDMIVDPLGIGILLKNGPMFAELRTKTKWTAVGFHLPRKVTSSRFSRKVVETGTKYFHVINVDDPAEIDDQVLEWLTEAYHFAGGTLREHAAGDGDGMVPDDVDEDLNFL